MPTVCRNMFLVSTVLQVVYTALAELSKSCSGGLEECGPQETCKQLSTPDGSFRGICDCLIGFHRSGDVCVVNAPPTASPSTSAPILGSIATALLWIIGILAFLAATLAVLIRRYQLLDRLYALRVRRYDTVFVSTAANVDDDAPIT